MSEIGSSSLSSVRRNPWLFVPLLYFLQAIPVSLVQDVTSVVYKDLGLENEIITRWTAIIAIPWSLQLLLGPLVDLTGTKRQWLIRSQTIIAAGLIIAPFALRLPNAFGLSLAAFFVAAIFSSLCNTAMDGFYMLAMPKDEQAGFAGIQTTCYRLGTLFCKGLLVFGAGLLMAFPTFTVTPSAGELHFTKDKVEISAKSASLKVTSGELTDQDGNPLSPKISVPPEVKHLAVDTAGAVTADGQALGTIAALPGATFTPADVHSPLSRRDAWMAILLLGGVLYGLLCLVESRTAPRPSADVPVLGESDALQLNLARTGAIVAMGLSGFFAANSVVRLVANLLWQSLDGSPTGRFKGWMLPVDQSLITFKIPGAGTLAELIQLAIAGTVFAISFGLARRLVRGTPMAEAFGTYFRQPGIVPILGFLMFYRFSEAMVMKISPLFMKDSLAHGGLGLSTESVGTIKGVVGVFGIVLGGIAGGWVVSKFGLRKSFWPIALCMHLPNLLYLWASIAHPHMQAMYGVDFCEQFGYGFGFAGYIIYQMRVAQRGNFRTAHYALGVGIGALFIQVAGILSGILQANFGYPVFFTVAILCGVPGLLTLLFIPKLDEATA